MLREAGLLMATVMVAAVCLVEMERKAFIEVAVVG
jgi:hypothetical protein